MESPTDEALLAHMHAARPDVTEEDATDILRHHYGLSGTVQELSSSGEDRNYRIDTGVARFVLKLSRATATTLADLEAQNSAMSHLRSKPGVPRVPGALQSIDGEDILLLTINGQEYRVRLLEYLDGEPLTGHDNFPSSLIFALGSLCAQITNGLGDFHHPGLKCNLQWDLRRAGPVTEHLLSAIKKDDEERDRIAAAMTATLERIRPFEHSLRIQAVHQDVHGDNILVPTSTGPAHPMPDAVIDFGDITHGWVVSDLAVTCAWLLQCVEDDVLRILPAVKAYHITYPLNDAELRVLWPLIVARAVILVASGKQELERDPSNDYVRSNLEYERKIFDMATSIDPDLMITEIQKAVGADAVQSVQGA